MGFCKVRRKRSDSYRESEYENSTYRSRPDVFVRSPVPLRLAQRRATNEFTKPLKHRANGVARQLHVRWEMRYFGIEVPRRKALFQLLQIRGDCLDQDANQFTTMIVREVAVDELRDRKQSIHRPTRGVCCRDLNFVFERCRRERRQNMSVEDDGCRKQPATAIRHHQT